MNNNIKVSRLQIRGLIVSTVIGVGILSLPRDLAEAMGNKGWIGIILSGLITILFVYVINKLFELNPGKDFFEIGRETLGKFVFTICELIILAYFIIFTAYITRILAELVKAILLPLTPVEVIILVFLLTCSYIARYEIDVIARFGYLTYPVILIFTILIIVISLPNADFTNLLPVTDIDITQIPAGIKASFFSFSGFEVIILALSFVENKSGLFRTCVIGMVQVTAIYLSTFIMAVSHFSMIQLQRQNYPLLQLAKKIELPGFFLENLDGLIMTIWIVIIFATVIPVYFGAGKTMSKIFKTQKHWYFILGLIPVIYIISIIPDNFIVINQAMLKYFNILSVITISVIPLVMLIVGMIRKKVKS